MERNEKCGLSLIYGQSATSSSTSQCCISSISYEKYSLREAEKYWCSESSRHFKILSMTFISLTISFNINAGTATSQSIEDYVWTIP
jgi:hypothetical protein